MSSIDELFELISGSVRFLVGKVLRFMLIDIIVCSLIIIEMLNVI